MNRRDRGAVVRPVTGRRAGGIAQLSAVATSCVVGAALFVACGGSSHPAAASKPPVTTPVTTAASGGATSTTGAVLPDVNPTAADFVNLNSMTRVGDHFVASLNGHLAAALAVAHSATGGTYPVGTVIQLVPTEAMVKRHKGYSPSTGDWEFFSLAVSPQGTQIEQSGAVVKNFFGGDCASCHRAAEKQFDFVCGKNHGCPPLPLTNALIAFVQGHDPRPKR